MRDSTRELVRRLDELGRVTDEDGRLTRTYLSPAMARANGLVAEWMREAGMGVREDAVGNVIGRIEGTDTAAKTLLLGSHLDTVRNAGRFDGALGVVLPIVALKGLRERGVRLPFAVEVIGFAEEESVRFPTAYLGSRGFTGRLRASELEVRDAEGKTLREVLERRAGGRFELPRAGHRTRDLLGYVEVHIEQGPVLEAESLAVGAVSAIASQTRGRLTFRGRAGHAGTTPMRWRRDALAGAAEFVLFAETYARARAPLVATVGTISVPGGTTNVIPGEVVLSLDVRHPSEVRCGRAVEELVRGAMKIAVKRGLSVAWERTMQSPATPCARGLTKRLSECVEAVQGRSPGMVSGAGHDAVALAPVAPVAMLFVRCRGGLSHHPDEYAAPKDLAVALRVMMEFLERMR